MPKHATSTSFKKGQQAALGNDKTAKLSTLLEIALKSANTRKEYEQARTLGAAIATDFANSYWQAKTVQDKKAVFSELMDRTEGKATQPVLHGEDNDHPFTSIFLKPEKLPDDQDHGDS
jgi:hypothetical protein